MTHAAIEHVNLTVSDPERAAKMMESLFGWHVRWTGPARDGGSTIHVGSETDYIAFYTGPNGEHAGVQHAKSAPLNHVGIIVDDLDAVERQVIAFGLEPFGHDDYEPGRRFYFFDPDGIEFEIISYAT
jgi:glyoxylase I family protein